MGVSDMIPLRIVELWIPLEPSGGADKALIERNLSLPPQQLLGFGGVREQQKHLTAFGAEARFVLKDCGGDLKGPTGRIKEFAHGNSASCAQLDHLALDMLNLPSPDESLCCVRHEREVAPGVEASQLDLALPRQQLDKNGRQHGSGGLPRPVGVERAQGHHRHSEGEVVRFAEFVSTDL